jgi:hypothetical protein
MNESNPKEKGARDNRPERAVPAVSGKVFTIHFCSLGAKKARCKRLKPIKISKKA